MDKPTKPSWHSHLSVICCLKIYISPVNRNLSGKKTNLDCPSNECQCEVDGSIMAHEQNLASSYVGKIHIESQGYIHTTINNGSSTRMMMTTKIGKELAEIHLKILSIDHKSPCIDTSRYIQVRSFIQLRKHSLTPTAHCTRRSFFLPPFCFCNAFSFFLPRSIILSQFQLKTPTSAYRSKS